ncbi:ribosome biogenesis GTPase Der [Geitlerinema sp. PCC 9228]|jgi:GTP-binding protein|uniref:ribosome biogenesis GTPase Der n=1 Tax=Geitlerinema sp. PCC 9228 TaxID=111611 RepID=UPI0008F9CB37|nr:ribosome biogenesis GTPase Der [Geitlerinema sp. PCC 9228]
MSLPVVAVIGRPNVGKSTLVNRIASDRFAIVDDEPGITRDRTYRPAFWQDRDFLIVDTGGLVFDDDSEFLPLIREQAQIALSEACAAIFVVNGQEGPTAADLEVANWLRQQDIPLVLAVNKCESETTGFAQAAEFWELGLGYPYPVSGMHGTGTGDLLDAVIPYMPPASEIEEREETNVAIVGRPNVGKSSLLNALSQTSRAIVSPIAGTTRDSLDMVLEREGKMYRLIDTAGIRKKNKVEYGVEFFSINRSFRAIRRSQVVVLVLDAVDGVTEQDQKLADRIIDEGKACVLAVNKWDALEKDSHTINKYLSYLSDRLYFIDWSEKIFISALTGKRVSKIWQLLDCAATEHSRRVPTAVVNEVIEEAVRWQTPPTNRQGKAGKIYYGTQVSTAPPTMVLFVNDPKLFKENYKRYMEKQFRLQLGFASTPIRLLWRAKRPRDVERTTDQRRTTPV